MAHFCTRVYLIRDVLRITDALSSSQIFSGVQDNIFQYGIIEDVFTSHGVIVEHKHGQSRFILVGVQTGLK